MLDAFLLIELFGFITWLAVCFMCFLSVCEERVHSSIQSRKQTHETAVIVLCPNWISSLVF
jgi:hypothetical protein